MMTFKRIFAAALLVLATVIPGAIGAWLLVDDSVLVPLLVRGVESLSDTRIGYQDGASVSRTRTPELRIDRLVVDGAQGHYRIETSSLRVQISLLALLRGRLVAPHLLIGDTRVNLLKSSVADKSPVAEAKQAPLDLSALRMRPVVQDLQIAHLEIVREGARFQLPAARLSELSLRLEPDKRIPGLSAQLEVAGERLLIEATLPELDQALQRNQFPFAISVKGAIADLSALGRVDFSEPAAVVQAEVHSHFPNLNKIPGASKNIDIPGDLTAKAQLRGTFEKLALEDLGAAWTGSNRSRVKLSGRIANVVKLTGVQLALAGQLADGAWLSPQLPDALGVLNTAELAAKISGDQTQLRVQDIDLKFGTSDKLDLTLTGRLALARVLQSPRAENLDLKLAFTAPTTRAARALIFDAVPELGAITASVDIRSASGDPVFENVQIRTEDQQGIRVDLSGRIAEFPLNPDKPNRGYDLDVAMQATETSVMAQRAGMNLPLSGALDLTYRIEGDTRALQLNQVKLSAGDKNKTLIGAEGRIHFGAWDQEDPLQAIDLVVHMRGRDTGFLSAWVEQDLPALAYHAQARLHTVSGQHRIDDYKLVTEEGEPLDVWETGSADKVSFLPKFSVQGIRLDTRARSDDVARLNTLFKLDKTIPAIGPLDLRMLVSGTDTKLLIDDVRLTAGQEDVLLVEAEGRVGYISAEAKWQLGSTNLDLKARSTSSQALARAFGHRIPQLGPVSAQAGIRDEDKTLGVEAMRIVVGEAARPTLTATGSIGDIYSASRVRIEAELNMGGRDLAKLANDQEPPDLGSLTGTLLISDSDGSLGMDTLHLETDNQDLLGLKLDGRFDDFSKPEAFELKGKIRARDANLLTALFGWEWPGPGRVEIDAQLEPADQDSLFKATLIWGKEKINMLLKANFRTSPPHIKGGITAHNFFLPDPAMKQREKLHRARDKRKIPEEKPFFSREPMDLGWMKKVDVDLSVDIQSFDRDHSEAVSAKLQVALKSGHLLVNPATLVYPKGQADLDLQVDAREHPKVSFTLSGENLDPWRGLKVNGSASKTQLDTTGAELDVNISLASSGESQHEMASNAKGEFYLTMKNGKIRQSALNLLFVDIVGWVSDQAKQRYYDVNCAIADYSIRQGLVTTNAFFMDTDRITIAGEGTIDLGKERIDYTFIPKKKSRLIAKAEPVTIKGSLNDPSIQALPVKSAALKFGALVFGPYVFAGLLAVDAVADYTQGELAKGNRDSSVCANYKKDLEEARKKKLSQDPDLGQQKQKSPFLD